MSKEAVKWKKEGNISSEAEKELGKYVVDMANYKIPLSAEILLLEALAQFDTTTSELQYDIHKEVTRDRIKRIKAQYRLHQERDRENKKLFRNIIDEFKSIKEDVSQYPSKADKGEKKDENTG